MIESIKFEIENLAVFKRKVLTWIQQFEVACIYDSHLTESPSHSYSFSSYELLIAAGVNRDISSVHKSSLGEIDRIIDEQPAWYFGFLSYDIKNYFEKLQSLNEDYLNWPDFYFFNPQILILIAGNHAEIQISDEFNRSASVVWDELNNSSENTDVFRYTGNMQARVSREKYLESVAAIKNRILLGDIYEVNYCQEFFSFADLDPYSAYRELSAISPSPFGCFFRYKNNFLLSASPERFLRRNGDTLISQPIKGTSARGLSDEEDKLLRINLLKSEKERAENVMIVDLVRNDLSKISVAHSVRVEELCGIYGFAQVYQLISTISCQLNTSSFEEIIKATFPMGSMTGAPKISAMQIAEKYESTKRGLYSGSVGYITPEMNFDLNVVIRSLQYNSENKYLSYLVGGAITGYSDAEKEYDECLIKASALESLLNSGLHA